MIMAYFERKDCVQRNLYLLNCVSLWKDFEGLWYRTVCLKRLLSEETAARVRRARKYIERAIDVLQGAVVGRPD